VAADRGIEAAGSGPSGQWTSEDWSRLASALGAKLRAHGGAAANLEGTLNG
jgi:hypothetical protein